MAARRETSIRWLLLAWAVTGGWQARGDDAIADAPRWQARETANFRILNYGRAPVGAETAEACERRREAITRQWLGPATPGAWSPKCHLVLHTSDAGYLREVGSGASQTTASALVERQEGQIVLRRIDVRAACSDWQSAALGHELAHVVLADRFAAEPLPRWLDEGMAILADSHRKRAEHQRSLERALAQGSQYRVAELLSLDDYPTPRQWGTFYGQSASLVAYLVAQRGHARFVEFVELALEHGYDVALERVYELNVGELERRWHRAMTAPAETVDVPHRSTPASAASASAG
jgi:hypothetical protein